MLVHFKSDKQNSVILEISNWWINILDIHILYRKIYDEVLSISYSAEYRVWDSVRRAV